MRSLLMYILPVYYGVYLFFVFFLPTYLVWKRTGEQTYLLGHSDNAHDFVGALYRVVSVGIALVILIYAFFPKLYHYLTPIEWLHRPIFVLLGFVLLSVSFVWTVLAQYHMGASWRIGFDEDKKTEFVQRGLFAYSRNPMFVGVRVNLLGFFLTLPNTMTFALWLIGDILLQIQVRMEEEYLAKQHGEHYQQYKQTTPRWLFL